MATTIPSGGRASYGDAVAVEPVAWPQRVLSGTRDLRIQQVRPLIPPAILIEEIPVSQQASALVTETRSAITDAIYGRDSRLIMVVGPCSIHDPRAALEFGGWLARMRQRYADSLILVMRTYFEKPRTAVGWKGLINDPDLDETFHINKGLRLARQLLLSLNDMGVPTEIGRAHV